MKKDRHHRHHRHFSRKINGDDLCADIWLIVTIVTCAIATYACSRR
jgi:hypothetical protein